MAPPTPNGVNGSRKASLANSPPSAWQANHPIASHFIGGSRLDKASPSKIKDFVQEHDGHSAITSVSYPPATLSPRESNTDVRNFRSSLPTMVLPQSRKSVPCENGPTRRSVTSVPFNSQSWPLRKICRQMPIIFVWLINMLRYAEIPKRLAGKPHKRAMANNCRHRFLVAQTTTIMQTLS